jgi:hemerythrin-like domain-containing protein
MEAYLNKGIKKIIGEFPEIESILADYGIGCGPCMVGTCLFKDIVQIHDLPNDQENEMMARIAHAISPDQPIALEKIDRKPIVKSRNIKYSPPMKVLVDEHTWIKRFVALIPQIIKRVDLSTDEDMHLIRKCIEFIRQYADHFHHAKEEDVLFKYFDESKDILKAMHEDHKNARAHVAAMIQALEGKDEKALSERLQAYGDLLFEHIRREDDILYPWMDRAFSTTQVGKLFSEFRTVEKNTLYSPKEYEQFIQNIEAKYIP